MVRNYMYLGFNLSISGKINDGLLDLHQRAQKAFYKLKNQMGDISYENVSLTIRLFDSLIKPILLYASDFGGCFEFVSSDKNPIEKLNTTMCKYILGLKKQVSNVAAKIEMGRYPIFIDAIKNCLNNWHRIQSGKRNYLMQLMNQNCSEYENWKKKYQKHPGKAWIWICLGGKKHQY